MFAFTFAIGSKLTKSIMLLDEMMGGEPQKYQDDRLDFKETKTVVVKKDLYAFKYGSPVTAYKIAFFTRTEHLARTTLSDLPRNERLFYFAVTHVSGNIVLTGGWDNGDDGYSTQTYLMDL